MAETKKRERNPKAVDDLGLTAQQRRQFDRIRRVGGGTVLAAPNNRFNLLNGKSVGAGVVAMLKEKGLIVESGDGLFPGMTQTLHLQVSPVSR